MNKILGKRGETDIVTIVLVIGIIGMIFVTIGTLYNINFNSSEMDNQTYTPIVYTPPIIVPIK